MKKLLFLSAIWMLVFSCSPKYSDELKTILGAKVIPEGKARAMKERVKTTQGKIPKKYNFHMDIYTNLLNLRDDVFIMPVVYSKDDEKEYRTAWSLTETDPAGNVEGYRSFIIQVGTNTEYYNFTEICPPPETCPE